MLSYLCLFSLLLAVAVHGQEWDNLRVTFGVYVPIINPYPFKEVPRTRADAQAAGWRMLSGCGESRFFSGERWVGYEDRIGDYDHAVMPLYDVNGYIAGIQIAVPNSIANAEIIPPMIYDPVLDKYTLTAYFVDPAIICTTGRTQEDFARDGTGDRLVFQYGTELMAIPMKEGDVGKTLWTKGQCFYAMGQHYWYNVRSDMSCDEFWPIFLLYNDQKLNSFGWAFRGYIESPRYEHPDASVLGAFFPENYPKCMDDEPDFSTIHIYMTDNPQFENLC